MKSFQNIFQKYKKGVDEITDVFLRNMVRAIVGTLLDVGLGKISIDDFKSIIENQDRTLAGASVKAKGLFLTRVEYPERIFENYNE